MHKAIKYLLSGNVLHVVGESGIGKTHFVQQLCRHFHSRYYFKDGIYWIDVEQIRSGDKLREEIRRLTGISVGNLQKSSEQRKNMLVVLDGIQRTLKHVEQQHFVNWVDAMVATMRVSVVLVSRRDLSNFLRSHFKKLQTIELLPHNEYEAADMLIAYNSELRHLETGQLSLHRTLELERELINTGGIPSNIRLLSDLLKHKSFLEIDI